jgi:hypothetical protein
MDKEQNFINTTPIKANATLWGCLFGACNTHNNIELAEQVAR